MDNRCHCKRLNVIALAGAIGIIIGVGMMALAWSSWLWDFATPLVQQGLSIYPGFEASLKGGFFGLGWGMIEGATCGVVLAWLYNSLCPSCCSGCCCRSSIPECESKE